LATEECAVERQQRVAAGLYAQSVLW